PLVSTPPHQLPPPNLDATGLVQPPVDVVIWPEDIVNIEGPVSEDATGETLSNLARGLHAWLLAGVVEGDGDRFHNAPVAIDPNGDRKSTRLKSSHGRI